MNGNIDHYPAGNDTPTYSVTDHHIHVILDAGAYAPRLLVDLEDAAYLERLANAIDQALAELDGQPREDRHPASYIRENTKLRTENQQLRDRLAELNAAEPAPLKVVTGR